MKTIVSSIGAIVTRRAESLRLLGTLALLTFFLSGCYYTVQANRYIARTGMVPWYCQGTPDLSALDCKNFAAAMDKAVSFAHARWTYDSGLLAGGTPVIPGSRTLVFGATATFDVMGSNVIHYESTAGSARAIGVGWKITAGSPPAGFPGSRDVWVPDVNDPGDYLLNMWPLRGYENQPDVLAATHPCETSLPLTATTDTCYIASHPLPLEIMVTNDDGYFADGIDALVQALIALPNVNVTVVAPLTQQSGQGDNVTPGGAPDADTDKFTDSGYPVLAAVHGTPADSVRWGTINLNLSPDIVISGMNQGQNLGFVGHSLSGTVGAARSAVRSSTHAIATSQENISGVIPDWATGAAATLALLEQWRIGAAGTPHMKLPNINIPTCTAGSVRGTEITIVRPGPGTGGIPYGPSDCTSSAAPGDDLESFLEGFTTIADMGAFQPPNYL